MSGPQENKCRIGGDSCTPGQLYEDGVCGKHYRRKKAYGTYELLCSVGKEECGPQTRLHGGMCRHHRFYADALPCSEPDCDIVPTADANKFVGAGAPCMLSASARHSGLLRPANKGAVSASAAAPRTSSTRASAASTGTSGIPTAHSRFQSAWQMTAT